MSSTSAEARAFVDTNIVVYAYDGAAGEKHTRARGLLEELLDSRRGCVSVQVLQELYVTLPPAPPPPARLAKRRSRRQCLRDLDDTRARGGRRVGGHRAA